MTVLYCPECGSDQAIPATHPLTEYRIDMMQCVLCWRHFSVDEADNCDTGIPLERKYWDATETAAPIFASNKES